MVNAVQLSNEQVFPRKYRDKLLSVIRDISSRDIIPASSMHVKSHDEPDKYFVLTTTVDLASPDNMIMNITWKSLGIILNDDMKAAFPNIAFESKPDFRIEHYQTNFRGFLPEDQQKVIQSIDKVGQQFSYWTDRVEMSDRGYVIVRKAPLSPSRWNICVEYHVGDLARGVIFGIDFARQRPQLEFLTPLEFAPFRELVYCNIARSHDPWDPKMGKHWVPYSREVSLEIKKAVTKIQDVEESYTHEVVQVGEGAEVGVVLSYGTLLVGQFKIPNAPSDATVAEQIEFYKGNAEWRERPIAFSFECKRKTYSIALQPRMKTRTNSVGKVEVVNPKRVIIDLDVEEVAPKRART